MWNVPIEGVVGIIRRLRDKNDLGVARDMFQVAGMRLCVGRFLIQNCGPGYVIGILNFKNSESHV